MIALARPLSRRRKRANCVAAASRLGVPTIPKGQLGAGAAQHGAPIPRSLRPLRQRPVTHPSRVDLLVLTAATRAALRDGLAAAAAAGANVQTSSEERRLE
jgi:hypothetical protein